MLLPSNFQQKVADTFYDKTITILDIPKAIDSDGGIIKGSETTKSTFLGNVRFNTLGTLQSEVGLTIDADITITCALNTEVALDDIISYSQRRYVVNNILPSDSHLTITGKECQ